MSNLKKKRNHRPMVAYRPLAIAALLASGTFQIIAPALAAGGLDITNKATATYNDGTPASILTPYNATSNTVTIRVNEVTGLTIAPSAPSTTAPQPNSTLYVDFTITNTGYDTTQVFIPGTATLSDTTNYQLNGPLLVMSVNGVAQNGTTGVNVPASGAATGDTTKFTFTGAGLGGSLPPNSTVVVRVPVKALGSASPATPLTVSLGDTPTASTTGTPQNNVVEAATPGVKDVYTVDNADGATGEYPGTPVDQKEVMATSATITPAARFQAFAAVLKANGGYSHNSTPNLLTDDTLTYNLALKVDNPAAPPAGLAPSDLYGTAISVNSASVNAVLVSDAIPANTQLASVVAPPTNWITVYTNDATTTNAQAAAWTTTAPTTSAQFALVKRVGFIYKTDAPSVGNGPIAKSATAGATITVSGFSFAVTPQAGFTGGQLANIAQVFGQSQPGTPVANTATQVVYDESGDQSYNDNLGGSNPVTLADAAGGINDGVADPVKDGIDPGTGTDPTNATTTNQGIDGTDLGGEATVFTIAAAPLTGPNGFPSIAGPGPDPNKVKDYTNLSMVLPSGLDPATPLTDAQTPALTFTNTVQNNSTAAQTITFVPSLPATFGPNEAALPAGTKVTIDPDGPLGSALPVVFTYNGTAFVPTGSAPTVSVLATSPQNYTVTVDLPSGAQQLTGYPVVINAFVDGNGDGLVGTNEPSNQTIDSSYTGYLSMLKEAQIQDIGGATPGTIYQAFTTDPALLGAAAQPNRVVEYRITYTNISAGNPTTDPVGNKALSANTLTVLEDGATLPNTWFASTVDTTAPTVGINGSLRVPNGSVITLTTAANGTVATDVKVYSVNVGNIAPAGTGQVFFDRKIKL
jgi:hypothetical protein